MSKLGCNIAMYHPDLRVLSARYRQWHVKAHLDEANLLIDRCIGDFKEFCSLDYAWHKLQLELRVEEERIDLERPAEEAAPQEAIPEEEKAEEAEEAAAEEEPAEEAEEGAAEEVEAAAEEAPAPAALPQKTHYQIRAEATRHKRELASPGQPFGLDYQRDLILKRLCRDYEEAVNRAWVAEQGLRSIFDYSDHTSPLPTEAESLSESITNLAIWIRNAKEWLVRYQQHEEAFTRVISVRSLLGRTPWAVLKQSRDSYSAKIRIPPDLFRSHDNCHLRSMGAWLVGEAGLSVPWSVVVKLPEDAVYERWGQSVEVDQSGRTSCLLGRVENRRSLHPVEHCGGTSWLNASPIGKPNPGGFWYLDIYRPAGTASEAFSHVEDLVLEICAVGIPQKNMS